MSDETEPPVFDDEIGDASVVYDPVVGLWYAQSNGVFVGFFNSGWEGIRAANEWFRNL
jgi:hypothetical protein